MLVVDDNTDAARLLGDVLGSYGHDVRIAHDGPRALAVAAAFRPEIAILDIGLPVMDGYELAVELHAALGDSVKLVAVTGYGQDHDKRRAFQAGFSKHYVKPVDTSVLLKEVSGRRRFNAGDWGVAPNPTRGLSAPSTPDQAVPGPLSTARKRAVERDDVAKRHVAAAVLAGNVVAGLATGPLEELRIAQFFHKGPGTALVRVQGRTAPGRGPG